MVFSYQQGGQMGSTGKYKRYIPSTEKEKTKTQHMDLQHQQLHWVPTIKSNMQLRLGRFISLLSCPLSWGEPHPMFRVSCKEMGHFPMEPGKIEPNAERFALLRQFDGSMEPEWVSWSWWAELVKSKKEQRRNNKTRIMLICLSYVNFCVRNVQSPEQPLWFSK